MADKQSFETNLQELEGVVKALEGNKVPLEEMLTLFERGISLTKACTDSLNAAEQKIAILMKNRDSGELEEQPFAGLGE